jgi:hypothetical protein
VFALLPALLLALAPCRPALTVRGPDLDPVVVAEFAAVAENTVDDVRRRLDSDSCAPMTITLVPAMEDAPALDPPWHLPSWAAGAAVPRDRRIVVGVTSGRAVQSRVTTLVHEVAHVVVADASGRSVAGTAPLPRWLDEGLARVVAGEHGAADLSVLARARVAGRFLPLAALERGFPPGAQDAALAYAEAGRAVSLIEGSGENALPRLLARLRAGDDVDTALVAITGRAAWQLERDVEESVSPLAALAVVGVEIGFAMGACGVVLIVAGVRARRRLRERIAAMDAEPSPLALALVRWTVRRG